MQIYGTSFHCRKTKGNFSFAQIASKDMLLQVIQKIAYPWCQAFLLLREPLSSHCTVRVEMVMQQSYFRCGYNIHSLLLSHAISSCLRKKILLMKKTLHIIELDVLNLTVLQWYIHERGNNSHQIWTVVANSDSSGKCPSPVQPSLSQTDLTEHCTHQLHSYPQYCHFRLHRVYFWTYLVEEIFIIYQTKLLCSCKEFVFTLSIALQLSNLRILQFYVPVSSSLSICRVKNMLDKW